MKKRKIFDIEKIGFGDEVSVSVEPKPISKKESTVMIQPTEKPVVKPVVNRPVAILNPQVNVQKERHTSAKAQSNSSRINTSSTTKPSSYQPIEFVSPITGRRVNQPKTVHLAHGQYQISTASMVEKKLEENLVKEVQVEANLRDEANGVVSSLNEELHELFDSVEEAQVCPSSTVASNVVELENDETTVDGTLSVHKEKNSNDEERNIEESVVEDSKFLHPEVKDDLLSDIASEVKELAETIVETISKAQEALEASDEPEVVEVTQAVEELENSESQLISSEKDVTETTEETASESKELHTSLEEDKKEEIIVQIENEELALEDEFEVLEIVTEEVMDETEEHNLLLSKKDTEEVNVESKEEIASSDDVVNTSENVITKSMKLTKGVEEGELENQEILNSPTNELEIDDVLALLDEEERLPSVFETLLSEEDQSEPQSDSLEINDVLTLLEEEEKQPSLIEQILAHSQAQPSMEEAASDELDGELFIDEDETNLFDDENFCDEVLAHVQIEEEEVQAIYYETPDLSLLKELTHPEVMDEEWIVNKMEILEQTFIDFGVKVRLTGDYTQGPTVTLIEIQPESGTKLNKIIGLSDDLKLSLSVEELRIEPIPGKNTIGVEIPNPKRKMVFLKEILSKPEFILHESPLYIGLGQDVSGQPVYADISTMPHGLIAGQTGSGKSVCINTLLVSMLYKSSPEDVRVMLIDPKRVELAPYNAIPHLITPVICDERKAAQGLKWAVDEMERRYELFATNGVRDIKSFNERRHEFEMSYAKLPYILIVIDELADLMMVSAQEVEDCIMRITQKARAAGIHLIVATQRPTVDVITGTIKSNIPSRIAFAVAQANDSRVILDETGAQNLLGQGDMLWSSSGSKVRRVQGAYISSDEIDDVVNFVKQQGKPKYLISDEVFQKGTSSILSDTDPLLYDAMNFIFDRGHATVSSLQTRLRIGFNRAARIIDTLEMNGWIGEPQGAQKQREILITREEFESMQDETRF